MSRSSVWTPRCTTQLWPPCDADDTTDESNALKDLAVQRSRSSATRKKFSFRPALLGPSTYVPPPPPSLPRKAKLPQVEATTIPSTELTAIAQRLQEEADELEKSVPPPSLKMQLGLMLLEGRLTIPKLLKDWDSKGKGEVLKGAMRNNLRNVGFAVTPQDADDLFNSWDGDGGGSLDLDELRDALHKCQEAMRVHKSTPSPQELRAAALRRRAHDAVKAAELTERAKALQGELHRMIGEYEARADLRLGALLQKRRIKPGAVVVQWATNPSNGLTKNDFRRAVLHLFSSRSSTPPPTPKIGSSFRRTPRSEASSDAAPSGPQTSTAEIDAVFDTYDDGASIRTGSGPLYIHDTAHAIMCILREPDPSTDDDGAFC